VERRWYARAETRYKIKQSIRAAGTYSFAEPAKVEAAQRGAEAEGETAKGDGNSGNDSGFFVHLKKEDIHNTERWWNGWHGKGENIKRD